MPDVHNKKYPRVSILNIIYEHTKDEWNAFLTKALENKDVEILKRTYYGIQYDMSELAKQKLNTQFINNMFLRLQHSLELTAKKIYKQEFPMPKGKRYEESKKARDAAFSRWLKEARY